MSFFAFRTLFSSDKYTHLMEESVCNKLDEECRSLASKGYPSVLLHKDPDDLATTDPFEFINEWTIPVSF